MIVSSQKYFLDRDQLAVGDSVVRTLHQEFGPGWLVFERPSQILSTYELADVASTLERVESATAEGAAAVGFLSYDAGAAFEPSLPEPPETRLPLIWFAVYPEPPQFCRELLPVYEEPESLSISWEWDFEAYSHRFDKVHAALARGEVYQANLTSRVHLETSEGLFSLFRRICGTQPAPYAAFLNGGDWEVASFSPELFLEKVGQRVAMSPMKGTRATGVTDLPEMTDDPKSIAENLMIVDMVRNDLGRIARVGTVKTPKLFEVKSHRTVKQMTSRVEAETCVSLGELFSATFPPASVTGAPKVAACRLIHELESSPRELYCGAIGLIQPNGDLQFSVAIRTAWKTASSGRIAYGIGSGVVWDSNARDEFNECVLKAEILKHSATQWELAECFHKDALENEKLLSLHWGRVSRSATYMGVPLSRRGFDELLEPYLASGRDMAPKVRVAVRQNGELSVVVSESLMPRRLLRATLAEEAIRASDPNLRHKTNSRQVYFDALDARPGFDEVLLFNERGEVAEFCRGNAMFFIRGQWVTPPPESGCLPGIGVKRLVEQGVASYGIVTVEQARQSQEIWFVNSIRGRVPIQMEWDLPKQDPRFGPDATAR